MRGANPGMKKCSLGKGTMLTASFLRSALSCPGKRRLVVTPDIVRDTRWFRSPYVGFVSFSVLNVNRFISRIFFTTHLKQISYKASLSMQKVSSVFSNRLQVNMAYEKLLGQKIA